MPDNVKPTTIMLIAGGAVLFISTLLDWRSAGSFGVSGWETDNWGLLGIVVALIGIDIAVGAILTQFTEVKLPEKILTLNHDQLHLALGFSAFLITFGQLTGNNLGIGIHLGWISAAVIVAAAVIDMRESETATAAPTEF